MKENYLSKNVPLISGMKMPITTIDNKGRIQLAKELRKELKVKPKEHFIVRKFGKNILLLEKIDGSEEKDEILFRKWLDSPAKIQSKKIKRLIKKIGWKKFLEKIDEEWYW